MPQESKAKAGHNVLGTMSWRKALSIIEGFLIPIKIICLLVGVVAQWQVWLRTFGLGLWSAGSWDELTNQEVVVPIEVGLR